MMGDVVLQHLEAPGSPDMAYRDQHSAAYSDLPDLFKRFIAFVLQLFPGGALQKAHEENMRAVVVSCL